MKKLKPKPVKMSIDDLEKLLKREDSFNNQPTIQILPNGQIVEADGRPAEEGKKPLTMKEDLGGEYAFR